MLRGAAAIVELEKQLSRDESEQEENVDQHALVPIYKGILEVLCKVTSGGWKQIILGESKFVRFLAQYEHANRKLYYFENWHSCMYGESMVPEHCPLP